MGDLEATSSGEVAVAVEFLFQLEGLEAGVGLASAFAVFAFAWNENGGLRWG